MKETSIYIAGVAEAPLGKVHDQSELSMVAMATMEALREAGLTRRDIDGIFVNYMGEEGSVQVGEYLGIEPRYGDSSDMGGGSFQTFVNHAAAAIATGRCEVALIAYASRQRSRRNRPLVRTGDVTFDGRGVAGRGVNSALGATIESQFEQPYGLAMPVGFFALSAARHMHQYGTTPEQLAAVAVAASKWAALNPKAWRREALTIEDVLASPYIVEPLRKLDCCLRTDGGGAVILTTEARARDAAKRPIRVLGAGEAYGSWNLVHPRDLTSTPGERAAREAFGRAGITHGDVDVLEMYDAFTICVLQHLEDLGFCGRGEAGAFVAEGHLEPGGDLPSLTSGGGLSYNHPGAFGILLLVEAVRQLRHEAGARQVPNAEIAVAHGMGGMYSTSATVVLARD